MLTEIYIEALLVDEELADQVWEAWDKAEIDDQMAWFPWRWVVGTNITAVAYSCPVRFFRQTNGGIPNPKVPASLWSTQSAPSYVPPIA